LRALKIRQVPSGETYAILSFIGFVIGIFVLVWLYLAIRQIKKSLKEIEKKLESSIRKDTDQTESTA